MYALKFSVYKFYVNNIRSLLFNKFVNLLVFTANSNQIWEEMNAHSCDCLWNAALEFLL